MRSSHSEDLDKANHAEMVRVRGSVVFQGLFGSGIFANFAKRYPGSGRPDHPIITDPGQIAGHMTKWRVEISGQSAGLFELQPFVYSFISKLHEKEGNFQ